MTRNPGVLNNPDPRVFSSFGLAIYDIDTLEVMQIISPVPRGGHLKNLEGSFQGYGFGLFSGEIPETRRKKYVSGKILPVSDPILTIELDPPYYSEHPFDGSEIACVPAGSWCDLVIKCETDDGIRYRRRGEDVTMRVMCTSGDVSKKHYSNFTGLSKIKFFTNDTKKGTVLQIKVVSPVLGMATTEALII